MKANSKQAAREKALTDLVRVINENLALHLIAISRFCGFGKKRMNKFLDFYEGIVTEFYGYEADEICREKIEMELESIGIDKTRVFEKTSMRDVAPVKSRQKEMSVAEASKMCQQIDDFKIAFNSYMAEQKKY